MHHLIKFLLFISSFAYTQHDTLLYKNHLDYYGEHAKSTMLTKDLKFLNDGDYIFKGSRNDFSFLLNKQLKVEKKNIVNIDTLYFYGKIKDSVKVGQWNLYHKNKKNGKYERFFSEANQFEKIEIEGKAIALNYGDLGKKTYLFRKTTGGNINYLDERILSVNNHDSDDTITGASVRERENISVFRDTGIIKYYRFANLYCGLYKYTIDISQQSEDFNTGLETSLTFRKPRLDWRKPAEYYNLAIIEKFKNSKLIAITVEYSDANSGKAYFGHINNTNYQSSIYIDCSECREMKKKEE